VKRRCGGFDEDAVECEALVQCVVFTLEDTPLLIHNVYGDSFLTHINIKNENYWSGLGM